MADDAEDRLLREIADKGGVSVAAFGVERALSLAFSVGATAAFGAAVYGYLSVFRRARTVLEELLTGLTSGHSRTIPRWETAGQRSVLFASLLLVVGFALSLGVGVVALSGRIPAHTLFAPRHRTALILFAVGLVPTVCLSYAASALRAYRQVRRSVFVSRVVRPGAVVVGVGAAAAAGAGGLTAVWLAVVAALTAAAVAVMATLPRLVPLAATLDRPAAVRDFLAYAASTSLVGLLGASQRQAAFLLTAVALSPVSAGLFSLSLLVAGVVRWPLKGINRALSAVVAELHGGGESAAVGRLYRRTSRVAAFTALPIAVVVTPHYRPLLRAVSPAYEAGLVVLPLAVAGQFLAVVAGSNGLVLLMTDNERPTAALHAVHAAVVLPVMVALTRWHGVVGLGAAYAFSLCFNNVTELLLLRRLEGIRLLTAGHAALAGLCCAGVLVGLLLVGRTPVAVSVPAVTALAVGIAVFAHRVVLSPADRRAVRVMLRPDRR